MQLKGQNIIVLGGGESGVGAALLAHQQGAKVFLSDRGKMKKAYQDELNDAGIEFEEGLHTLERILTADEVIKSPGIPDGVPLLKTLSTNEIPVIGEIEFASRFTTAKVLAITGSNGKTTTAYLIHHLLINAGIKASLVGNVGFGFARSLAQDEPADMYVMELSSFQLDSIKNFRPHLATVLNITADHLDRYDYKIDLYADSKLRIAMNQQETDHFWYLKEDTETQKALQRTVLKATMHSISKGDIKGSKILVDGEWINLAQTQLRGKHNALNALFACQMLRNLGIETAILQKGLESFQSVPHRLESVAVIDGVEYINDSKATNVDAVTYALDAMTKEIIWIVGGIDKGNDYSGLIELVKTKVKAMICLGTDNTKLKAAFGEIINDITETDNMAQAIALAKAKATNGQVVLLSPACSSFDLFDNYAARGDQFRTHSRGLTPLNKD